MEKEREEGNVNKYAKKKKGKKRIFFFFSAKKIELFFIDLGLIRGARLEGKRIVFYLCNVKIQCTCSQSSLTSQTPHMGNNYKDLTL